MNRQTDINESSGVLADLTLGPNTAPSFFTVGLVTTEMGDYDDAALAVVVQSDGNILVAGESYYDFALARYLPNGSLDTGFGSDGLVKTDFSNSYDAGSSVTVQADGKILVAGTSNHRFALARYHSDGTLDTGFSGDGLATTGFDPNYYYVNGSDVAVQADGKILVAGTSGSPSDSNVTLVRYNADGSMDTGFGNAGVVITSNRPAPTGLSPDYGYSVAVQADGSILVGGTSYDLPGGYGFFLLRYHGDGSLDSGFDGDGLVTTDFDGDGGTVGYSLVTQSDGKILVAGSGDGLFALARYNADGSLDAGFDGDGKLTTDLRSLSGQAASVTVQADGRILVAGFATDGSNSDFALVRYDSDGALDTSFGRDGIVITDFDYGDSGNAVTLQADGKIVVAGSSGGDFAVVRYNADGSLDSGFGTPENRLPSLAYFYEDGGFPAPIGAGARIFDAELDALGSYEGASLTLVRHGGASADDQFSGNGYLYFDGDRAVLDGVDIGTVVGGAGALSLTFNGNATQRRVDQALSGLVYRNGSEDPPSAVQLDWSFSDGNTGAQGTGGALATLGSTTVQIVPSNDAPTLDAPGALQYLDTAFDDRFASATGQLRASDVDSTSLTYGVGNGTDNGDGTMTLVKGLGSLTVDQATGAWRFVPRDFAVERLTADTSVSFAVWVRDQGFRYANDWLVVNVASSAGTESPGDDLLVGGASDDLLTGLNGADTLVGGAGDDLLAGGAGDDVLEGGEGVDGVREGGDADFVLTDSALTGMGADRLTGIEWARLIGGLGDNRLDASGFSGRHTQLEGGAGNDTLVGGGAVDWVLARGDLDFTLSDSRLIGDGTDVLAGIDSARLVGGEGDNRLDCSAFTGALVVLEGGAGDDNLVGRSAGVDRVRAEGSGHLVLTDTQLIGLGTDTLLNIEEAALFGADGDDTLNASAFTRGSVRLFGGGGDDTLVGGGAGDGLDGGAGDDSLAGGADADSIGGGLGNDSVRGGAGDDLLMGGAGQDSLTGGAGADRFRFVAVGEGADTIADFVSGTDRIQAVRDNFGSLPLGRLGPNRLVMAGTPLLSGDAVFIYSGATGALAFDSDGNGAGAAVPIASLGGGTALLAADIEIVGA